jgi:hypothetical protein
MRSNVGRRVRAGVELDLRVLELLVAKPGVVAIEVSQSSRVGDWQAHLTVVGESEYEASSTVWYVRRADAECVAEMTVAALRQSGHSGKRRVRCLQEQLRLERRGGEGS